MKLLLVGPYPPPHGGISVHVAGILRSCRARGMPCRVLNINRDAAKSTDYIRAGSAAAFLFHLVRHSLAGWTIHVHTNGHNLKSWLVALCGGIAGWAGMDSRLTLHSGMVPEYLAGDSRWRRFVAAAACRCFYEITCVNARILRSIGRLGIPQQRLRVEEAFLGVERTESEIDPSVEAWLARHRPVVAATGSSSPEYGIGLLTKAVQQLVSGHPDVGVVVIGPVTGEPDVDSFRQPVLMIGDIPHDQCLKLISRSHVFVRPTFADGDSISVREALAFGVPVVASDCVERPAGSILFRSGDEADLMAKMQCVFQESLQDCVR